MRLAIYDGFTMFREALTAALVSAGFELVGCADEPVALATLVNDRRPDACVLTDTPGVEPRFSAALQVRRVSPATGLLLLTDVWDVEAQLAYDGRVVDGVVSKTCEVDVLEKGIRRVLVGERVLEGWSPLSVRPRSAVTSLSRLTDREREVLTLIAGGASTTVMSTELGVSVNTVRTHVQSVLDKLNVHHRTMAARVAVEHGLCSATR
jgi:two-component system nitrate/nitrite response regulator NarL